MPLSFIYPKLSRASSFQNVWTEIAASTAGGAVARSRTMLELQPKEQKEPMSPSQLLYRSSAPSGATAPRYQRAEKQRRLSRFRHKSSLSS